MNRKGLVPLGAGVALIAAGVLGMHASRPLNVNMNTVQPSRAQLRAIALRSAILFPPYRVLGVYTMRAPNFTRRGGGYSGMLSQVLVVLGGAKGAVLAVSEAAGPVFGNAPGVQETGWQTVLPPAPRPVQAARLAQLPLAEQLAITDWQNARGLKAARLTIWPFPGEPLVVASEQGQSIAAAFPAPAGSATYVLGGPNAPALEGSSTRVFRLRKR